MSAAIKKKGETSLRRFKPYPAYKDTGVEWLGDIPVAWDLKRLKRIVRFRGGGTPAKDVLEYWGGEILWVSPKDMKTSVVLDTEDKITTQAVRESATNLVPAGAVLLVVRSGILAHSIPVALAGHEVTLNQDLKALIPNSELVPEYLMYLIAGMQRELLVEWRKEGATVESLELELIANTQTPLPSTWEQGAIAAFLDRETAKIDALVAKKERLIELLHEESTAIVARAVTKGLDPNVPMKESGVEWLGEIPAHWRTERLKYLAMLNPEALPETTDVGFEMVYVDIGGVDSLGRIIEKGLLTFGAAPTRARRLVKSGDVIVSTVRTYLRAIAPIAHAELNLVVSTGFAVVRPGADLTSEYAAYALRTPYFVERVVANSKGVSFPAINESEMATYRLAVPPGQEQRAIAAFLDRETARVDQLAVKIRDAIDRLKELRTTLISAAVTGKIDARKEAA